jgi:prepilin-type N-terminal cleavage/methylation domain-containing protein
MTMVGRMQEQKASRGSDDGFTLIEVIVAMILLTIVMTGLAFFFIKGQSAASGLQRREAAVALANQTMEQVRAVPPAYDGAGLSKLVTGRTQTAVNTQWTSPPSELANTARSWDATATGSSLPVLPLTASQTVGGQPYKVDIYIGTCQQPATTAACSSALPELGNVKIYRVVVRVGWNPGAGRNCSGSACEYLLTTLIDPESDQTFNSSYDAVVPVAVDDASSTAYNTPVTIDVLPNDTGTFNTTPVSITTAAAHGSVSTGYADGTFTYTPTAGYFGTDTLQYRLTDSSGQLSNIATVTITVASPTGPTARAIALSTAAKTPTSISLLTGNTGTFPASGAASLTGVVPAGGSVTANGTFSYTPGIGISGPVVFTYRLTDVASQTATNTVTVTVAKPPVPTATTTTVCIPSTSYTGDLMTLVAGTDLSPSGLVLDRTGINGWVVTNPTATSGVVAVTTRGTSNGTLRITIKDPWGQTSAAGTITLTRVGC